MPHKHKKRPAILDRMLWMVYWDDPTLGRVSRAFKTLGTANTWAIMWHGRVCAVNAAHHN